MHISSIKNTVRPASTGAELRALVTDIYLDGTMTGIGLAEFAKQKFPALNGMISGKEIPDLPIHTLFFQKPYQPGDLLQAIAKISVILNWPVRHPDQRYHSEQKRRLPRKRLGFSQCSRERSNSVVPEQGQKQDYRQRHAEQPKQCASSKIHVSSPSPMKK